LLDRHLLALPGRFQELASGGAGFLTLPVALVGGVLAALIDGATLSLGALIAFLALLGLAARNGVMLIDRLQRLRLDDTRPLVPSSSDAGHRTGLRQR
jgi:Cu/Ag efflux pump CusA